MTLKIKIIQAVHKKYVPFYRKLAYEPKSRGINVKAFEEGA
jgi:hypothetical protein